MRTGATERAPTMEAAQNYRRLAWDCLQLSEATRDVAAQQKMIRLAELWARLADRAESRPSSPEIHHDQAA